MRMFEIEDLHEYLVQNRLRIDYVALTYMWSPYYIDVKTDFVVDGGRYDGYPLTAVFSCSRIDEEYSFYGRIDEAIKWIEDYGGIWDCCDFSLSGCVLHAEYDDWNDLEEYHDEEESIHDVDVIDIEFSHYEYWSSNKRCYYEGPMRRQKDEESD